MDIHGINSSFWRQLEYLSVDNDDEFSEIKFHNLQQLKVSNMTTASLNGIICSAMNLQQIHLSAVGLNNQDGDATLQDTVSTLIQSCSLLKYISIEENEKKPVLELIDGIKNGLLKTNRICRNTLKIQIEIHQIQDPTDLIPCVSALVSQMRNIQTNDYMFIWKIWSGWGHEIDANQIADKLGGHVLVTSGRYGLKVIAIQNDGCKINGYNESWKM